MAMKNRSRSRPLSSSSFSCRHSDATFVRRIPYPSPYCGTLPMEPPVACNGLVAGHHLLLGVISRHHFERLGSNEEPASDTN
jgi:hypothetical protein